jgi:hypothetical protein
LAGIFNSMDTDSNFFRNDGTPFAIVVSVERFKSSHDVLRDKL